MIAFWGLGSSVEIRAFTVGFMVHVLGISKGQSRVQCGRKTQGRGVEDKLARLTRGAVGCLDRPGCSALGRGLSPALDAAVTPVGLCRQGPAPLSAVQSGRDVWRVSTAVVPDGLFFQSHADASPRL